MPTSPSASIALAAALLAAAGLALAPAAAFGQSDPLAEPFPPVASVTQLTEGSWLVIGPGLVGGQNSLAGCRDVNGDGLDDVLLAPGAIVFGRAGGETAIDLNGLEPDTGVRFFGSRSAGRIGDINGDGIDDFALGDKFADGVGGAFWSGRAYVVFGREDGFPDGIDLATLDGTNGFTMLGAADQTRVGSALGAAGDINGDGIDDLLVAQDGRLREANGALHIIFGRDQAAGQAFEAEIVLDEPTDGSRVRFDGRDRTDWNGSVDGVGDVNGDGIDDIAVVERSRVYVLFGRPASEPWPRTLGDADIDGTTGFATLGLSFLSRVARAGDFNGDGINDILIGAPFSSPGGRRNAGSAALVFGRSDRSFPALVDLDALDPGDGFVMEGIHSAFPTEDDGDRAGYSIAGPGDLDGDGFDDIVVGAPGGDYTGTPVYGRGEAYLVFGREAPFTEPLMFRDLDGRVGVVLHGGPTAAGFASSAQAAGDFNGDGRPDVLINTGGTTVPEFGSSGGTYVLLGRSVCEADLDGDGDLTIFDFLAFQNAFDDMDPIADFDGDGDFTILDFLAFQNAFDAGCP